MNPGYTVPTLCDLFHARNIASFKETLRPGKRHAAGQGYGNLSSSLSRSPRWEAGSSHAPTTVINRRDIKGRTALHLAVATLEPDALEYVQALLESPHVNVNLQDPESGWTALHRALYAGNLLAARMLVAKGGCDMAIKDHEGFTALDVWNSTIDGTNPDATQPHSKLELFTWGSNRDFVLGFSNDNDRPLPERVSLRKRSGAKRSLFGTTGSKAIVMSKVATGVVTMEQQANVRFCGLGYAAGKTGKAGQTQFALESIADFSQQVVSVALGLDHTVLLTASGEVFTYGHNHFGQLGYVLDPAKPGEEALQMSPRRVASLKKETILGVAASKYHTACYSADALFTFGANKGQLGYASAATQVQPRQVSNVPGKMAQVVASDLATVCLLDTGEVFVLFRAASFKMSFSMHRFPSAIKVYRPPTQKPTIAKLAAGGSDVVAISDAGDAFQWKMDDTVPDAAAASRSAVRMWDLRRKSTAIVDAAVFNDSLILCTRSGHVFVRERRKEGARHKFKFSRIPFLQRAVAVSTNGYGAYGAIRSDVSVPRIPDAGSTLPTDLLGVLPHWVHLGATDAEVMALNRRKPQDVDEEALERDAVEGLALCRLADAWDVACEAPAHGADAFVAISDKRIPVHGPLLAARSPVFAKLLYGRAGSASDNGISYQAKTRTLVLPKTSLLVGLLLLHYIYSDGFPFLWDPRISSKRNAAFPRIAFNSVREELQRLAHLLQLPALGRVCGAVEKVACTPLLAQDLARIQPQPDATLDLAAGQDLVLRLEDGAVHCHSVVLRARCPFFSALLDDPVWTARRRSGDSSLIEVDMHCVSKASLLHVLRYAYADAGHGVFDLSTQESTDRAIDHIVAILALADELMIDQLKTICCQALIPFVDLRTAGAIFQDADTFNASALADACAYYLCCNLETALESGYLTELPAYLMRRLAEHGRARQGMRAPVTRSNLLVDELRLKYRGWLEEQDVAKTPTGLPHRTRQFVKSPQLSPSSATASPNFGALSPTYTPQRKMEEPSPVLLPERQLEDDLFQIDDLDLNSTERRPATPVKKGWQMPNSTPTNLRQIMAAQTTVPGSSSPQGSSPYRPPNRKGSSAAAPEALPPLAGPSAGWARPVTNQNRASLLSIQAQQLKSPVVAPAPSGTLSLQPERRTPTRASPVARPDPSSAVGVPIISPTRVPSGPTKSRNQEAWVNYSSTSSFFAPATPPAEGSSSSFSAIQNAQQDEGDLIRNLRRAPRSLAEIQQEEAFETWFANEQKKYQEEQAVAAAPHMKASRRGQPHGRGRGRGRGGPKTANKQ